MQVHYTCTEKLWACLLHITQKTWAGSLLISQNWQKLWTGPLHITEKLWTGQLDISENPMGRSSSHNRNNGQFHYPSQKKCWGRPITHHSKIMGRSDVITKNYGHYTSWRTYGQVHYTSWRNYGQVHYRSWKNIGRSITHGETMGKAILIGIIDLAHSDIKLIYFIMLQQTLS